MYLQKIYLSIQIYKYTGCKENIEWFEGLENILYSKC